MNKRTLHRDLLFSGKYRQQVVKAKKGKGSYQRREKYQDSYLEKHRQFNKNGGVFYSVLYREKGLFLAQFLR